MLRVSDWFDKQNDARDARITAQYAVSNADVGVSTWQMSLREKKDGTEKEESFSSGFFDKFLQIYTIWTEGSCSRHPLHTLQPVGLQ